MVVFLIEPMVVSLWLVLGGDGLLVFGDGSGR